MRKQKSAQGTCSLSISAARNTPKANGLKPPACSCCWWWFCPRHISILKPHPAPAKLLLLPLLPQLFINNEWVDPKSGGQLDAVDPRTGDVIKQIASAEPADVDAAVRAARKAFDEGPWQRTGGKVSCSAGVNHLCCDQLSAACGWGTGVAAAVRELASMLASGSWQYHRWLKWLHCQRFNGYQPVFAGNSMISM
jgi:hypothetical protein